MKKKLLERMERVLVEITNIHNLAYTYDMEDSQEWLNYQDELNRHSIERKKQ